MKPGRGWTGGQNFRPARDVDVIYGHGLVKRESANWPRYIAVTTPTAWKTAQPYITQLPAGVSTVSMLDWDHLDNASGALPDDAEMVVGIGGGTALDASKYVALKKDLPLRLVPTAVSTGAIIHGVFANWKGHSIVADPQTWPYCDFEHVLVDYDLILEAPWYLNTAGIGDVLCMYSGISEWRHQAGTDDIPPVDQELIEPTLQYYQDLSAEFPRTLDSHGDLTAGTIALIMKSIHERDDRQLTSQYASGAGHSLTQVLEEVLQTGLIHGEVAALGGLAVCWAADDYGELVEFMGACKVRYRPADMGLRKDQLRAVFDYAKDFYPAKGMDTILGREPLTGKRFDDFWEFIES